MTARVHAFLAATASVLLAGSAVSAPTAVQKLDNGLQVAVFRDARLPVVQIHLLVPAGVRHEGPLEAGAARLTALLLRQGTSSRSAAEYATEVERMGGAVVGRATPDYAVLSGSFRAADLERGLELVADAAINPIFDEEELARARDELLRALLESRRHLGLVAEEHVAALVLKDHPYALPELGTPEIVAALTRARILGFHRALYRPDRALLGIAGDVDPDRAVALARERFGAWVGRARSEPPATAFAPDPAPRLRLVDAPGAAEAEIRIGLVAPGRGHQDAAALTVANDLLGGTPGSRLSRGSARGVRVVRLFSALQLHREGGLMVLGAAARNDSVPATLARLRDELARLGAEPPLAGEVEASRRTIARAFPIQNEPLGIQSVQWLVGELLGLGPDHPARYPQRIAAVSADAVRGAIARWLGPSRASIVVVGDAAALRPALEKLGTLETVSIQSPPLSFRVAPAMRLDPPDAAALEQGRRTVDQMVAAHGGLARLRSVKDSRVETEITIHSEGRTFSGRQIELRLHPDRFNLETKFREVVSVQSLEGDRAWTRVTSGGQDSIRVEDAAGVAGLQGLFASDVVHLLMAASDPGSRVAHRGRDQVGDAAVEVIEVVTPDSARRVLFVDATQHRLLAVEENEGSVLRGPVLRRTFGQFRSVKGVLWPHSEERLVNGIRAMTVEVSKVELDTGIRAEAFKRPEGSASQRPRR